MAGFKLTSPTPPATKTPSQLRERILALRAELDACFDELAAKDAGCGIPLGVLRQQYTNRASGCECRAYLIVNEEREAQAKRLADELEKAK